MNLRHFVIFATWSILVMVATGALLIIFTYGDCFDDAICTRNTNRNFWLIVGTAFVVYWAVAIRLFRRWSR
ncbi:hypothetical protein [Qipengyuania sediminis]|uniref:hypothetical protein n=1 Tax=Qipengyuania sediminis TaxID=1532023 RepID=UPI001059FE6E|nr:hypothetical protein [Qipengyuania sediminis]